jgi:hypothetical protein
MNVFVKERVNRLPEPGTPGFVLGAGFDLADPKSRWARFYLRYSHVVAVLLLGACFVLVNLRSLWHTDVWGHLRFGESIVQQRALPQHERFSGDYADQDAPYINYQWLSQAGAYLVFDLGRQLGNMAATEHVPAATRDGKPLTEKQRGELADDYRLGGGVVFLQSTHAALVTLRLVLLLLAFRRLTGSLACALVGVVLEYGMGLFCHVGVIRPQVVGELFFAAVLLALSRPLLSRRALFFVPLAMVLWANSHGSFPIGFVLLAAALVAQAWQAAAVGDGQGSVFRTPYALPRHVLGMANRAFRAAQVQRLAAVLVLSLAAVALLNPHGPNLFVRSWELANHPNIRFMEEWKPLPLKTTAGYTFLATLLALAPLLRWSPRRFTSLQILLLLGFGWQTLAHTRVLVWWIMVYVWVVLPHVYALWQRWAPALPATWDLPSLRKTALTALAVPAVALWTGPALWFVWGEAPLGSKRVTNVTPLKAAAYIRDEFTKNPELPRVVFASETEGEFLLWDLRLEPPVRVFAYTHVHLFTPEHWRETFAVKSGEPTWQAILDRHAVQFVVVEPDMHPLLTEKIRAAKERWQVIASDPVLVAKRR